MNYDNKKVAGALLFLASVQFLLLLVVAEAIYPDCSVSQDYISDLGVGCTAYLFNFSVILLGAAILAGAYFIHRAFQVRLFPLLLMLAGIGAVGVGVFPEDTGLIHGIAALITFSFGGISAIVSYNLQKPPFSYFSVVLGAVTLVALVLFMTNTCLGLGPGGMERMVAYPVLLWGTGFGGFLMDSHA
jgi:hypothetical membrane protein